MAASHRLALACATLVSLGGAAVAGAQGTDSSASIVGATMVDLRASAWLRPGPNRSFATAGAFQRFVSAHWELGLTPVFALYTGPHATSVGTSITGTANYMVGGGRTRAYVGGYAGGSAVSQGSGSSAVGAQAGALYFLAPTTALRAEFRTRRWDSFALGTMLDASVTLEPYVGHPGSGEPRLPAAGVADASLSASMEFNLRRERHLDLMIAPFLSSWAQVGGEYEGISNPIDGEWLTSHRFSGFARLYAPLSPRVMPFVHGFTEGTRSPFGSSGPTSYGLMSGVRHYFNRGTALDAGLQWRHYRAVQPEIIPYSTGGVSPVQLPDQLTIQARIVVELRTH